MLGKVKLFVKENFKPTSIPHFDRAIFWLKKLEPEVDESMLIAAYTHDIGRPFQKEKMDYFKHKSMNNPEYLKRHQKDSAKIIAGFLKKNDYPQEQIKRIHDIVLHHEEGGHQNGI